MGQHQNFNFDTNDQLLAVDKISTQEKTRFLKKLKVFWSSVQ